MYIMHVQSFALVCRAPVHSIATQALATGMYTNKVYYEGSTALFVLVYVHVAINVQANFHVNVLFSTQDL